MKKNINHFLLAACLVLGLTGPIIASQTQKIPSTTSTSASTSLHTSSPLTSLVASSEPSVVVHLPSSPSSMGTSTALIPYNSASEYARGSYTRDEKSFAAVSTSAPLASKMPFKLGFEFQETSGLCAWALDNVNVQKKPIFQVIDSETNRVLWHVVIDTNDIEFVTSPFAFADRKSLEKCLKSLHIAMVALVKLLRETAVTNFEAWAIAMAAKFGNAFYLKLQPQQEDKSLILLYNAIKKQPIALKYFNPISPDSFQNNWTPNFAPQVTIQHPLEYTIPLYFGLLGFDDVRYMFLLTASLPGKNLLHDLHKMPEVFPARKGDIKELMQQITKHLDGLSSNLMQKVVGLAFLHAQTLVAMTPKKKQSDTSFLKEILKDLNQNFQVDAKRTLTLMSRRPFSEMLRDIKRSHYFEQGTYYKFFKAYVEKGNSDFNDIYEVPSLFAKTNYGEEYFNKQTGKRRPLLSLGRVLNSNFSLHQDNTDLLVELALKGVISTAMIRNFLPEKSDKYRADEYYEIVLKSVDNPSYRYIVELSDPFNVRDPMKIISKKYDYDALSPPWFLGDDDAMGYIKGDIESKYGEAIVEVRAIKNVGAWFCRKTGLDSSIRGLFLTKLDTLEDDAELLFEFLSNFGTEDNFREISLGILQTVSQ